MLLKTPNSGYDRALAQLEQTLGIARPRGVEAIAVPAIEEARVALQIAEIRAPLPLHEEERVTPRALNTIVIDLDRMDSVEITEPQTFTNQSEIDKEIRREAMTIQAATRKYCYFPFFRR